MGVYSPTIYGNDLAEELKGEYSVAFAYYDVEKAVAVIEEYVSREYDLDDEYELCDYVYSLADYMWKRGILTESVKQRALYLIDNNVAIEEWELAGKKELNARLKVLKELKERLLSPMPPKKKITIKYYTKPIFEIGDAIAIKLKTLDKIYNPETNFYLKKMSQDEFKSYNDKYIILLKADDIISYTSSIVPEVSDIWPCFKIYNKVFDEVPTIKELKKIDFVKAKVDLYGKKLCDIFMTEGSMSYFKKRDYIVLGKDKRIKGNLSNNGDILFGINREWESFDTKVLAYILENNGRRF